MAFYPLFTRMADEVNTVNIHAQELFEIVIENKSELCIKEGNLSMYK